MGIPPQPPIVCDLQLEIEGPDSLKIERTITHLDHEGSYSFGKVDLYESDSMTLQKAGDYTFRLTNRGEVPLLRDRGADISLTRFTNPTDWYVRFALLRAVAWGLLIIGVIAAPISEIRGGR